MCGTFFAISGPFDLNNTTAILHYSMQEVQSDSEKKYISCYIIFQLTGATMF